MTETLASAGIQAHIIQTGDETVVEVEFSADLVQKAYTRVAREVSAKVQIPGFRRGHAPPQLVEGRVGQAHFQEWVGHDLLERHGKEILKQAGIQLPTPRPGEEKQLRLEVDTLQPGQAGCIRLRGPIVHLRLPDIQEFEQSYQVAPVTDQHIEDTLEQIVQDASKVEMSSRSTVEWGDLVSVDLRVSSQGRVLVGQDQPERLMIEVGRHQYVLDLDPLLPGMERHATRTSLLRFPDDYPDEELRGKNAEVQLTVIDIFEIERAEMDEAFLQSRFGTGSLPEVREILREELERASEQTALAEARGRLVDRLAEATTITLPVHEVERETQEELAVARAQLQQSRQVFQGSDRELEEAVRKAVERRLRRNYLLDHLAEREKLVPSESDLMLAIQQIAQAHHLPVEQVMHNVEEDEQVRQELYRFARRRLASDFILDEAHVYREDPDGREAEPSPAPGPETAAPAPAASGDETVDEA